MDRVLELLRQAHEAEQENDRNNLNRLRGLLHKAIDEGDEIRERRYRDLVRLHETGKYPGQE